MKEQRSRNRPKFPSAEKYKIAIIVSQWHSDITESLFNAAYKTLLQSGCREKNLARYEVPGSFELIYAAKKVSRTEVDAVICLGCLIKGETPHFDFISNAVANGIANLNIFYPMPFIFGVLTTNTLKQAQDRSGGKSGNKGEDCALAALEMIRFRKV